MNIKVNFSNFLLFRRKLKPNGLMVLIRKTSFADEHRLIKAIEYFCPATQAWLVVFGNIGEKAKGELAK
jgi:hypothetical protein